MRALKGMIADRSEIAECHLKNLSDKQKKQLLPTGSSEKCSEVLQNGEERAPQKGSGISYAGPGANKRTWTFPLSEMLAIGQCNFSLESGMVLDYLNFSLFFSSIENQYLVDQIKMQKHNI